MDFNPKAFAMPKAWHPPKLLPALKLTVLLSCLSLTQLSVKASNAIPGHEKGAFSKPTLNVLGAKLKFATTLKGVVKDETGATLPGVSLSLTGNDFKQTASTNDKGEYHFNVPKAGTYTLTASFVGYGKLSQTVTIGNTEATKNISLVPSSQALSEVMVVAYGKQTKASFTGSAKELKGAVISGSPRASVQESLQGNVAGLISSNGSGQPGAVPNIRIRGIGSINAGSGPLYVVDGVPLESGQISGLNSYDIENLTVLKDTSAASIYGSRAANGVILITTKSGKAGKTVIAASVQAGVNNIVPIKGSELLNTNEVIELLREGWANRGNNPSLFDAEITLQNVDKNVNTDWFDLLTRTGNQTQADISISGGTEKSKFYISASHYIAKAPILGSDFIRSTANVRLSNQVTDKLFVSGGLQVNNRNNHTQSDGGSFGNPIRMYSLTQPFLRAYNDDGSYDFSYFNRYNPVAQVLESYKNRKSYGLIGSFQAKYNIVKNLSIENQSNINFLYGEDFEYNKAGVGTARTNGGIARSSTDRASTWVNTSFYATITHLEILA